jgi:hypothetical protein
MKGLGDLKVGDNVLARRRYDQPAYFLVNIVGLTTGGVTAFIQSPNIPHFAQNITKFGNTLSQEWQHGDELYAVRHKVITEFLVVPPRSKRKRYFPMDQVLFAWKQQHVVGFMEGTVEHYTYDTTDTVLIYIHVWDRPLSVERDCLYIFNWQSLHAACSAAVHAWMWCCKCNLGMHRDVARLIGMLVWETRDECEWEEEQKETATKKQKT